MKVAFYDAHSFEKEAFCKENEFVNHDISFIEARLTETTATLAKGHPCVCAFVNDRLSAATLEILKNGGTGLIALRSAGLNHIDLKVATELGIRVTRVPEYSPYAIAEHVIAMIQTLNRKTHRAYNRVREGNFSLNGLVGFDLHGKTVGIVGTGRIGRVLARILVGFGCQVLLHDLKIDPEFARVSGCHYAELEDIYSRADIISLHTPLTPATHHLIDKGALAQMKKGVMLINTGRGALIDTKELIESLKTGHVGHAGLDVYEEEEGVFFEDLSGQILGDDVLARLLTFSNVLITSHQAFLTREALSNIAATTLFNITEFEQGKVLTNGVG
jgi:D-lactate dehydrogenase